MRWASTRMRTIWPTRMEGWATLPDGTRRDLVEIDDWDIDRQSVYRFAHPVPLPKGAVLHMRYVYDNSAANVRNPHTPGESVQAIAEGKEVVRLEPNSAADWNDLGVLEARAGDRAAAHEDFARALRLDPANEQAHANLAKL